MNIKVHLTREENINHYNATEIEIDIEEYLKGVVSAEVGNAHIEACAAQAVCARTYAMTKINSKGYITDKSSTDQAFRASRLQGYPNAYEGVAKTAGEMLYYNGKLARTYFSNSNGGRTTSSKERWGGDYPYLISQDDPYDNGSGNGHGVGLSQVGAGKRAAAGHTYKEILNFYFPGTTLQGSEQKMTIEQYILQWCKDRIGCPYIYGATQQKCTTSYRKARMKQYPDFASSIKSNCLILSGKGSSCSKCKWYDKKNNKAKPAYDCAQFVRWGAAAAGLPPVKSGATSQWKSNIWAEKGNFADVPKNKLCCVFRDKDGTKAHVGWYYNGIAYHAQGHSTGVVETNNKQYKSWTHYAIMNGIYDSKGNPIELKDYKEPIQEEVIKVLYQAKVASKDSRLNMREAPDKNASRILQIPPQAEVDVIEETNVEWVKVIYNNKEGYVMKEFLAKVGSNVIEEINPELNNNDVIQGGGSMAQQEEVYYVRIKCANKEEAERLAKLLRAATV